ncbi:glucosyltransferase domain-containing protein [Pseudomonas entomophila]|uniref:glucosyltransferase domain-containing protein n=1 Tax=Pseudomonas entomophila TaxID=312306 RepID=UPI0024060910|nr:glucosyltransferase domain-containing protein [Pseudomonas entomophila]MDF9616795.1 glucosyltransferase domain-containing protein [Pseudomonas entomophila]
MSLSSSWNRPLTSVQLWLLLSAALALHIVPLLMADMPFMDDFERQHLARNDWVELGRPLASVLLAALSFGPWAVNIYPLPMLLAVLVAAHALGCLVRQWFAVPTLSSVLVVLPLWYQPYFLQNLSYHYDSASMVLSMVLSLWAITLWNGRFSHWFWGVLLVAAVAALYQPGVNVFAGLCAIEVMRLVMNGQALPVVCRYAVARLGQLLLGCMIYYFSCTWMIRPGRLGLLAIDGQWLSEVARRSRETTDVVGLLITPWVGWILLGLALLAGYALVRAILQVWRRPFGWGQRLGLVFALILPLPVVALCVSGIILFLVNFDTNSRLLMGLGVLLALLFYLVHGALAGSPRTRVVILTIPLLFMLSFSFAYGRILVLQKTLQQAITQSLAHDLSTGPELATAKHYYLLGFWLERLWIPAARETIRLMPALEKVDPYKFLLLPEMLPRMGVDDFHAFHESPPLGRRQVLMLSPTPLVVGRFYDIHLVGDAAYVLFKNPEADK